MALSIRGQLILTFLGAVALALVATALALLAALGVLMGGGGAEVLDTLSETAAVRARAAEVGGAVRAGGDPALIRRAAIPPDLPDDRRVQVVALDGTVWADSRGGAGRAVSVAEAMRWLQMEQTAPPGVLLREPIYVDGELWGYYLHTRLLAVSPTPVGTGSAANRSVGLVMLGGQAVALVSSLLLFWAFGRRLVQPVRHLSRVVAALAGGDLTARSQLHARRDELGQLARDVDSMAARLQEAAAQVAAADQARRYMIAAVSHDLRTPLTAVLAHAEAVRTGVSEDPARSLVVMEEKGLQMKDLIDDLFELAALDADVGRWRTAPGDVAELVRQAVAAALPELEQAGFAVDVDIPPGPVPAQLPQGKLERVLDNLLDNARKYGAPGGWLGVRLLARGDWIRVEVADHGPGIPPGEQERVFDRFYRAGRAGAAGTRGSGLGLAIARETMLRLGGRIGVESPPGGGTRFWLEVPAAGSEM